MWCSVYGVWDNGREPAAHRQHEASPTCQRGPGPPTVALIQVEALVVGLAVADLTLRMAVGLASRSRTDLPTLAAPGLVFVVGVILLVLLPQPLGLFDEGSLIGFI